MKADSQGAMGVIHFQHFAASCVTLDRQLNLPGAQCPVT